MDNFNTLVFRAMPVTMNINNQLELTEDIEASEISQENLEKSSVKGKCDLVAEIITNYYKNNQHLEEGGDSNIDVEKLHIIWVIPDEDLTKIHNSGFLDNSRDDQMESSELFIDGGQFKDGNDSGSSFLFNLFHKIIEAFKSEADRLITLGKYNLTKTKQYLSNQTTMVTNNLTNKDNTANKGTGKLCPNCKKPLLKGEDRRGVTEPANTPLWCKACKMAMRSIKCLNVVEDTINRLQEFYIFTENELNKSMENIVNRDFAFCKEIVAQFQVLPCLLSTLAARFEFTAVKLDLIKVEMKVIALLKKVTPNPHLFVNNLMEVGFIGHEIGTYIHKSVLPKTFEETLNTTYTKLFALAANKVVWQIIYVSTPFDIIVSSAFKDQRIQKMEKVINCDVKVLGQQDKKAANTPGAFRALEVKFTLPCPKYLSIPYIFIRCMLPKKYTLRIGPTIMKNENNEEIIISGRLINLSKNK